MVKRGLVVLAGKATRDQRGNLLRRNLEAHFYFPYIDKRIVEKEVLQPIVKYALRRVVTSHIGNEFRVAVTVTRKVKSLLPQGITIQDWWSAVKGVSPTPFAIYKGVLMPFKTGDFRRGVLRFEIPSSIRKKYDITAGQVIVVKLPELSFKRKTVIAEIPTDTSDLVNKAFEVLDDWLDYYHYGKSDVPVLSTAGSELTTGKAGKIQSSLEKNVFTPHGDNDFHLRVFDYDYNRVPISSDFDFNPDWFLSQEDVDKVKDLAVKNTMDSRGRRGRKPNPASGQTTLTGGSVP